MMKMVQTNQQELCRFLVVFCILLWAPGADRVAVADPLPIEIGPIGPAETPLCFNFGCDRTFTVSARDPERGCDDDNDVIVEWNLDGAGWETGSPASGQGLFEKTYPLDSGNHTLRARAKEIDVPPPECDDETGEDDQYAEDLDFCLFELLQALAGGQTYGRVVDCGQSIRLSADVTADCDGALLRYDIQLDGEDYEVKYEPPSGFDYVPKAGGDYTVIVSAIHTCGSCAPKQASFSVPCDCSCCGPPKSPIEVTGPDLEYYDETCSEKLGYNEFAKQFYFGPEPGAKEPVCTRVAFSIVPCYSTLHEVSGVTRNKTSITISEDACGRVVEIYLYQRKVCYGIDVFGVPFADPIVDPLEYKKTWYYPCEGGSATHHECEGIDSTEDPSGECS